MNEHRTHSKADAPLTQRRSPPVRYELARFSVPTNRPGARWRRGWCPYICRGLPVTASSADGPECEAAVGRGVLNRSPHTHATRCRHISLKIEASRHTLSAMNENGQTHTPAYARAKRRQGFELGLDEITSVCFPRLVRLALDMASQRELEHRSNYIRRAVIKSLRSDGFLELPATGRAVLAEEMTLQAAAK